MSFRTATAVLGTTDAERDRLFEHCIGAPSWESYPCVAQHAVSSASNVPTQYVFLTASWVGL